jgi:hypothetical protein
MSQLLEDAMPSAGYAYAKLKTLPDDEQDAIALIILEEIEDERRWDEAFSRSPHILANLAATAMAEYKEVA